ncbi:hypothetical protein ACSBOB_09710 [Mesorhizobium sp. ASY16-5R]|uniref:hypothetical protein n=1 Tax=Mesorhizobium sp. ASY16-5R TaxID=3445772 RepID=UPI003FA08CB6
MPVDVVEQHPLQHFLLLEQGARRVADIQYAEWLEADVEHGDVLQVSRGHDLPDRLDVIL